MSKSMITTYKGIWSSLVNINPIVNGTALQVAGGNVDVDTNGADIFTSGWNNANGGNAAFQMQQSSPWGAPMEQSQQSSPWGSPVGQPQQPATNGWGSPAGQPQAAANGWKSPAETPQQAAN